MRHAIWFIGGILLLSGCGSKSGGGPSVAGTASVVNGATAASRVESVTRASARPASGNWMLTPDTMTITLKKLQFLTATNDPQTSTFTNCTATFDKKKPGLAALSNCDFSVAAGTYVALMVGFDATVVVTLNNTVDNYYTDGTGIVRTPPAGGVKPTSLRYFSTSNPYPDDTLSSLSVFGSPLTIGASDTPKVTVAIDGTLSLRVDTDNSGNATFQGDGDHVGHPDLVATANGMASIAYYLPSSLTFADVMSTSGFGSVRAFYNGDGSPAEIFFLPGPGAGTCPVGTEQAFGLSAAKFSLNQNQGGASGFKYGGYLGRDASAKRLEWAAATSTSWTTYSALVTLDEVTALGTSTSVKCKGISTDPAPPGDTFSGTIADLTSPSATLSFKLVAH